MAEDPVNLTQTPKAQPPTGVVAPGSTAHHLSTLNEVAKSSDAATAETVSLGAGGATDPLVPSLPRSPRNKPTGPTLPEIEGFELLGRLGRGGMGVVYRARDCKLNRIVALKLLHAGTEADEADLARFEKEARMIAQLQHPHIVQVFEIGQSHGLKYLALEHMNGGALTQYLDGTPLPARTSANIIAILAEAAAVAHRQGIVHRDLKPGNILVSLPERLDSVDRRCVPADLQDSEVVLKLADFGLAKSLILDESQTLTGVMLGTPRYAAPEQARGDPRAIAPATDVYALGAILYELTTGAPVFRAADVMELLDAVRMQDPIAPRLLNPSLDRDLETICLKCLSKSPAERYSTAGALAADLRRYLRGEPIQARPVGAVERTVKWVRRHPGAAALWATSGVAVLSLLAFAVSLMYQNQLSLANQELTEARSTLSSQNSRLESQNSELENSRAQAVAAETEANTQRNLLVRHRYAGDMLVAGRAWREGDIARMKALLDRNVSAERDLRGFEWYYLRGLERSELARLPGVTALYLPGDKQLVIGRQNEIVLLDAASLQPVRRLPNSEGGGGYLAVSADGQRLLAGGFDTRFRVWSLAEGKLLRVFDKHSYIGKCALSADGSLALTTGMSDDRTVKLWRVEDGEVLADWKASTGSYAAGAAFSPDGKWFATGWPLTNSVRIARVSEPDNFSEVSLRSLQDEKGQLNGLGITFHKDSQWLYVTGGTAAGMISLNNLSSQSTVATIPIQGALLDLSPDGSRLVTLVSADNSLRVWDAVACRQLHQFRGPVGDTWTFSLQGKGPRGVSSGADRIVRVWDCQASQEFEQLSGLWAVNGLRFSPDGRTLAIGDAANGVTLVEADGRRQLTGPRHSLWDLTFSPDGKLLAAASFEGKAFLWSVADGGLVHTLSLGESQRCFGVAFNAAGTRLVTSGTAGRVQLWDVAEGKELQAINTGQPEVYAVRFRPLSGEIVAYGGDGTLQFWDSEVQHVTRGVRGMYAPGLLFTADGSAFFAATNYEQDLALIDVETLQVRQSFSGHLKHITSRVLSPDGQRLATGSADGTVKFWDVASGQETLSLPGADIRSIALSPDGKRLAVGPFRGEVRIYDASRGYAAASPE